MSAPDDGGETADIPEGRDAAASAWDSVAAAETGTPAPEPASAPAVEAAPEAAPGRVVDVKEGETDEQAIARARDEHGRFKKTEAQKTAAEPIKPTAPLVAGAVDAQKAAAEPKPPPTEPLKPPGGWTPQAREKWSGLPPEVQQEVHRLDRERSIAYQRLVPIAKTGEAFQRVMAPFEGMIRAEGGDPIAAVDSVMRTAAALRTAPPGHKAALIANMVKTFGVPIEALDAALAGHAPPPGAGGGQGFDPSQLRQEILGELRTQLQQERQQSQAARAQAEVEAVASKLEFFDDVREDMGDLMELAARRGKVLTTEQAYEAALRAPHHSGILDIVNQRKAAESAKQAQAQADKARAAGSSIRGQPASAPPAGHNGTFKDPREAAVLAWEQHANG